LRIKRDAQATCVVTTSVTTRVKAWAFFY